MTFLRSNALVFRKETAGQPKGKKNGEMYANQAFTSLESLLELKQSIDDHKYVLTTNI
jgi:hypothetical protein